MAAAPAAAPALAPLLAAFHAAGLATQADLAPLATRADLAAAIAPVQAQVAALQLQVNGLAAQLAALPTLAQLQAVIQAALAPHNAPVVAAAASAIVLSIANARRRNNSDERGVAFTVVPLADGTLPTHWPAGFDRHQLVEGLIATVDNLLEDYGLPHGAPASLFERRNALARHIGTPCA